MLSKFYLILGGGLLALYGFAAWSGWEMFSARRKELPPQYRTAGGYRNVPGIFWYSGYRGGK
jgi:hypothetical protein